MLKVEANRFMNPSIALTTVDGMKELVFENEKIRTGLMPEFGPRIVSIIYKPTGRPDKLEVAVNQWKNYAVMEPEAEVTWTTKVFLNHNVKNVEKISAQEEIIQK